MPSLAWTGIINDIVRADNFYLSDDEEDGGKKPVGWGFLTDEGWKKIEGACSGGSVCVRVFGWECVSRDERGACACLFVFIYKYVVGVSRAVYVCVPGSCLGESSVFTAQHSLALLHFACAYRHVRIFPSLYQRPLILYRRSLLCLARYSISPHPLTPRPSFPCYVIFFTPGGGDDDEGGGSDEESAFTVEDESTSSSSEDSEEAYSDDDDDDVSACIVEMGGRSACCLRVSGILLGRSDCCIRTRI